MAIDNQVKILSLAFCVLFFGFTSAQQYVTTFFVSIGLPSAGFYSLIILYFFFTVFCMFGAVLVPRHGAKKLMAIAVVSYFLFIASLATGNIYLVYLLCALIGICAALLWISQGSYIIRISDEKSYGASSGFFNSTFYFAQLIGIVVAGFLITVYMFRSTFIILSIFPLLALVPIFFLKDVRPKTQTGNLNMIKKSFSNPFVFRIGIMTFSSIFVYGIVAAIVPIEIKNALGIAYIGPLTALFFVVPAISAYFFGKRSDIVGRMNLVPYSYLVTILGLAMLYFSNSIILFAIGILFLALSTAIASPIAMAIIGDVSNEKNLESITSFAVGMRNASYVVSLLISSIFISRTVYMIAVVVMLLSLFLIMPLFKANLKKVKSEISREIK